jgi:hypothetical protein
MNTKNKNLEQMILNGWRPSFHGECLDCYNKRSTGKITSTILTGISYRNMHYVVIEVKL